MRGQQLQRSFFQGLGSARLFRKLLNVIAGRGAQPKPDQIGKGQGGVAIPLRPGLGYFPANTLPIPQCLKISSA